MSCPWKFTKQSSSWGEGFWLANEAVELHNQKRPSLSLSIKTPNHVHLQKNTSWKIWVKTCQLISGQLNAGIGYLEWI